MGKKNKKDSFELKAEKITFKKKNNKDNGDGDGDKPNNNNIENKPILNFNKYINEALYPLIKQNHNISPSNIKHADIIGNDNCLF